MRRFQERHSDFPGAGPFEFLSRGSFREARQGTFEALPGRLLRDLQGNSFFQEKATCAQPSIIRMNTSVQKNIMTMPTIFKSEGGRRLAKCAVAAAIFLTMICVSILGSAQLNA